MKSNSVVSLLMAILFINVAVTAYLAYDLVQTTRIQERLARQRAQVQQEWELFQRLVNDTLEYSKRNPAIDPVLQSLGLKTNAPSFRPTNAPPAK